MARLIRTEKEIEGRFEDVWLVVEEDPLEQWPEGPLDVVGRPATRLDGPARVRGEARFTADLQLRGMLHAAIVRSPHAHARVRRIDFARALAAPGVRCVLGPGEAKGLDEEAGYAGAPVAALAADTFAQARAALGLVDVEWEELEAVLDPEEAVARGQFTTEPERHERGDFERALAEADVVVERTYRTSVVLHNSMETHQAVCEWVGDTLNVYISTQYIWGVRAEMSSALGIPADKVRVVCDFMGGGFGSKNGAGEYTAAAAELARRTGRPVRCMLTRREENTAAGNRNATIQKLVAGARSDGTIVALGGEFVNAVGWGGWSTMTDGPMRMLYACDNVRTVCYGAKINTPPMKPFRAPGFVEGTFGLESLIDELAAWLHVDPFELRRMNYADSNNGTPYSSKNLAACYELAPEALGPPARGARTLRPDVEARHRHGEPDLVRRRRPALVRLGARRLRRPHRRRHRDAGHRHGHVHRDGADRRRRARRTARPRGRRPRRLRARRRTSTLSAGSSTVPSLGPAVRAAAADAKRQILEIAAQRFGVGEETLDIRNGTVGSADGSLAVPLEELLDLLGNAQILGKGARGPNPAGMSVNTFGVQVAEVAVDVETGEVRVGRIAAVHDVGRVVNPLGARSQVEGGIIQGIGHTLSEVRLLDPETGTVLTTTLDSYRMPTIADVPEIVCEFVDKPDAHLTNLGSKGLGEPPIVPTAAAIANAIRDATGADVHELPICREEMLRALREAEEQGTRGAGCGSLGRRRRARRRVLRPRRHGGGAAAAGRDSPGRDARRRARRSSRAGSTAAGSAPARRSRELEVEPAIRPRCARRAGWPPRRSSQHGLARRQPPPVDALLVLAAQVPVPPARRRPLPRARRASTASTRSSRTTSARRRIRRTSPRHSSRSARGCARTGASSPSPSSTGSPTRPTGSTTTLEPGELILEVELPPVEAERLPQGDGPEALVVPPGRRRRRRAVGETRIALAGVAPVPWLLAGPEALDGATPLPRTAWKVDVARALVRRAVEGVLTQ